MKISKYLYNYLVEMNPNFGKIKITNNIISQKYLKQIDEDPDLKSMWDNVKNNLHEMTEIAIKKNIKSNDSNRKYLNTYYRNYWKNNDNYRRQKSEYYKNKTKEFNQLKQDNIKLNNILNVIKTSVLNDVD